METRWWSWGFVMSTNCGWRLHVIRHVVLAVCMHVRLWTTSCFSVHPSGFHRGLDGVSSADGTPTGPRWDPDRPESSRVEGGACGIERMTFLLRLVLHVCGGCVLGSALAIIHHSLCDSVCKRPAKPEQTKPQWWVVWASWRGPVLVPCRSRRDAQLYCSRLKSKRFLVDARKGPTECMGGVTFPWRERVALGFNPFCSTDCMRRALLAHLKHP